jgi:hypothetical protein
MAASPGVTRAAQERNDVIKQYDNARIDRSAEVPEPGLVSARAPLMGQRADVHCGHCGHVSGTWVWPVSSSPEYGVFREVGGAGRRGRGRFRQLRCLRCHGPVRLEEIVRFVERPKGLFRTPARGRSAERLPGPGDDGTASQAVTSSVPSRT